MPRQLDEAVNGVIISRIEREYETLYSKLRLIEKEARYLTWIAYMKRNQGRLFDPGPHVGLEQRHWWAMEDQWYWKAIGCVPIMDGEYAPDSYESAIAVGMFLGVRGGWMGEASFQIGNFTGPGSVLHRSPLNIEFVYVLPEPYQFIATQMYTDEDERADDWDTEYEEYLSASHR